MSQAQLLRPRTIGIVILVLALLSAGCASKGKAIQAGAAQFEAASLATIEKIDTLRRKETAGPIRPPAQASDEFISFVLASTDGISNSDLGLFADPFANPKSQAEAEWQTFLQRMRQQYVAFAAMFGSLDRGGLFSGPSVESAVPILDKLIAQMAAFAQSLKVHPVELVRERSAIAEELEAIRDQAMAGVDLEKRELNDILRDPAKVRETFPDADVQLRDAEVRLRSIMEVETQLTREAVEQALVAARLGKELRNLLVDFNNLSVNEITEGLTAAFKLAAAIPGLDVSGLQAETESIVSDIQADSNLSNLFDTALNTLAHRGSGGGK